MALAAHPVGRLLNQSELARDAALPQPTVHRHLNLLETGCLIARLAPYATNPTTGLVKSRKLYWSDCGLAAWLAGIRNRQDLSGRLDQGFWLEQAVFQSLLARAGFDQPPALFLAGPLRPGGGFCPGEKRGSGRPGNQGGVPGHAGGCRWHQGVPARPGSRSAVSAWHGPARRIGPSAR
jgi:hypothetical protein